MMRSAVALAAMLAATRAGAQAMPGMAGTMPAAAPPAAQRAGPPAPTDHAADAVYDPQAMARARRLLLHENGGMPASMLLLKQFELRAGSGATAYRWEGEGFVGGDIDRLAIKSEGEWRGGRTPDEAEVQALYSHAIAPYFNLQAGVRHDFPAPRRTYATIAIEGLAPYWFEVEGALFLSTTGDLLARAEASYDQRITQRLVLQPQVELNLAAQDVPATGARAGLSDIDAGLRLRYEIVPNVAPYLGVAWQRAFGRIAGATRRPGDDPRGARLVAGIRLFL